MHDTRLSVDKVKEIVQTLLKDHEAIICSESCFYDFDRINSIWEYIAVLMHYYILEAIDNNAIKSAEKLCHVQDIN